MSALTLGFFELLILVMLLVLIGGAVAAVVWFTRKGSVGGGRERVRTEAQPTMDFARLEAEYGRLKAQFERGALTEADFKAQLEELMIEDEQGRWWILGYETGQWYVHDGEQWVQQEPPRATPSAPPAHPQYPRATERMPDAQPQPAAVAAPLDTEREEAQRAAKKALWFAIAGLFIPFILASIAIVQARKAKKVLRSGDPGYRQAVAAQIIGWIAIVLWVLFVASVLVS